jgi:hypothetical protein
MILRALLGLTALSGWVTFQSTRDIRLCVLAGFASLAFGILALITIDE